MNTFESGGAIERTMEIKGVVVPAVIHNGNYYFVNLPIYADGLVDAWGLLDLPLFEEKLRSGWVTPGVPDGEYIHVHGLGSWEVQAGSWSMTSDGLLALVRQKLRELNPELRNLYDCQGTTTKKVGNVTVSILGGARATPIRPIYDSAVTPFASGRSLSVFAKVAELLYLADLRVFDDAMFEIGRTPSPRVMSRDEFVAAVDSGDILSEPASGQQVEIHGLGSFVIGKHRGTTSVDQLLLETSDVLDVMQGRPNSLHRCRAAFATYNASPSEENRAALRLAYEAIPVHNRRYVGNMDTKDVPIRMIVYGEEELEAWSHRVAARERGIVSLPTIAVPQPADDDE